MNTSDTRSPQPARCIHGVDILMECAECVAIVSTGGARQVYADPALVRAAESGHFVDRSFVRALGPEHAEPEDRKITFAGPEPVQTSIPGVPAVFKPTGGDIERMIDEYIGNYTFEGDGGCYSPNDHEQFMIKDAIIGLLSEPSIVATLAGNCKHCGSRRGTFNGHRVFFCDTCRPTRL